jgi:rhodanese-related sulfurtransferase
VREEDLHAQEHPLFAANLPLSRIEIDAYAKLPNKSVPIIILDDGEEFAQLAAQLLANLGFTDVSVFERGASRAGRQQVAKYLRM